MFTLFDSIGQGLRDTEQAARRAASAKLQVVEDYLNQHAARSVIIENGRRRGPTLISGQTPYAFFYPDEIHWLIPRLAFEKHCQRDRLNPKAVLADIVRRGVTIEKRPHPDKVGAVVEFVVWIEERPILTVD